MSAKNRRMAMLAIAGLSTGVVLRRTVLAVASNTSKAFDASMRKRFLSMRGRNADVVSQLVTILSAPALLVTGTSALAFSLRRRGRAIWLPIAAAPFLAMTAGAIFSRTLPQQNGPDSTEGEPGFPSGHTTGLTAEAATIAYICRREDLIGSQAATALLTAAFLGGINRLYRDRHWATDIIAGWSAGLVIAAFCATLSEVL